MWNSILRYFYTVRYLKPVQVYYLIRRKLIPGTPQLQRKPFPHKTSKHISFLPSILVQNMWNGEKTFSFLNLTTSFDGPVDWNFMKHGMLWAYNLNYFDFLFQTGISKEEGIAIMKIYDAQLEHHRTGLEPFPLSVRLINWIKFLSLHQSADSNLRVSVYQQALVLRKQLEYHLLANHILENGFALFFAGYFLGDHSLTDTGRRIMLKELHRQILPDGGHVERSTMYHSLITYRLLDCINLVRSNDVNDSELLQILCNHASNMLGWLRAVSFSDHSSPMVNDAAEHIAPTLSQLVAYADTLDIKPGMIILAESGYRKINTASFEVLIDVGDIGPEYQPGHAHADTFNFLLMCHRKYYISDTAVSTYEEGDIRQFERSTAAHNTVTVANTNSSDVWKSFRVGQRARIFDLVEESNTISARHDGYKHLGTEHKRTFEWNETGIIISDEILGKERHSNTAYIHFHPGISVSGSSDMFITDDGMLRISFTGLKSATLKTYLYASGFNQRMEASYIEINFAGKLVTHIRVGPV